MGGSESGNSAAIVLCGWWCPVDRSTTTWNIYGNISRTVRYLRTEVVYYCYRAAATDLITNPVGDCEGSRYGAPYIATIKEEGIGAIDLQIETLARVQLHNGQGSPQCEGLACFIHINIDIFTHKR